MSREHYDFAGWATKNNIRCSDGRTIRHGAFSDCDGKRVPLVWMHNHKDVQQVLGHADLEDRDEGTYAYCSFNGTAQGQNAKEYVQHGDVVALSIYANQLRQNGGDVIHGDIKEVSLVLAGANRGAVIDSVLSHGELSEDEAEIRFVGYGDILCHKDRNDDEDEDEYDEEEDEETEDSDEEESDEDDEEEDDEDEEEKKPVKHADEEEDSDDDGETIGDVLKTLNEKQKKAVAIMISQISAGKSLSHADDQNDDETSDEGESVEDVYNTLTPKQKKVVDYLVGSALEQKEGGSEMKHNAFEESGYQTNNTLSHDDFQQIFNVGKQMGSLKAAFEDAVEEGFIAHTDGDYGITNLEYLFPEAKTLNTTPEFIKRDTEWVTKVLDAAGHSPFSRVKTLFADITEDAARAKGYIKGKYKKEEVFALLKRITEPQTIYKKQKLDKDDLDDINNNFNVLPWMKAEMQLMLKEEIARAILIGDGRLASDDDKIREINVRPIYNDEDLFTVKVPVTVAQNATDDEIANALIRAMVKARKLYKGSGNPKLFTTDEYLTDCLLVENGIGDRKYDSEAKVATAMRVSEVVPVEVMEGKTIEIDENGVKKTYPLIGVEVNMKDYNIGTNGGAKTDFFDGFDLDFNQHKYLYETRMSGALVKPFSAISFYLVRE